MKPREKKPEEVYRIIDRKTGRPQGSYSRAYCDEYDFESPEEARDANCSGMFRDKKRYAIAKYRVTYELIEEDVEAKNEVEYSNICYNHRNNDSNDLRKVIFIKPYNEFMMGKRRQQ